MRTLIIAAAVAIASACAAPTVLDEDTGAAPAAPLPFAGQTLYTGGAIYTGAEAAPTASAVLVDGTGTIAEVITGPVEPDAFAGAALVNLNGATLFPGFVDAHAHLRGIGLRELTLDLSGISSVDALKATIAAEAGNVPEGTVLFGRGWIETGWPEGRMPMAADLDEVAPGHIVILTRADGHALVANALALETAGITNDTPDPDGGAIERDAAGTATGILVDNAMGPVLTLIDGPNDRDISKALAVGADVYVQRGWTGMHNMSVSADDARLLEQLDLEDRMPLRVYNALDVDAFEIAASRAHETDTLSNRAVKLYMDGALGSRGALLSEPYADRPTITGLALLAPDELRGLFDRAAAADVQLAIHAIGDLANTRVIEAAEAADVEAGRHRIEHTQILRPQDIARLAPAGLIASMQPSHAIGDLKFAPTRLGMERLEGAYAWQSVIDAGAIVAAGSDAPVEVGSPLIEFYAATVRKDLDGVSGEGWHPEEAVSRETALKMMTYWPAYASFAEETLGTIEVGKQADFSAFDRDLMTVPGPEILEATAVLTVVNGDIVHNALQP